MATRPKNAHERRGGNGGSESVWELTAGTEKNADYLVKTRKTLFLKSPIKGIPFFIFTKKPFHAIGILSLTISRKASMLCICIT